MISPQIENPGACRDQVSRLQPGDIFCFAGKAKLRPLTVPQQRYAILGIFILLGQNTTANCVQIKLNSLRVRKIVFSEKYSPERKISI